MIVDMMRSHFITPGRVVAGSGQVIDVLWYPAAPTAQPLPFDTRFGYDLWDDLDPEDYEGLGMLAAPHQWRRSKVAVRPGTHYHGRPEWYVEGLPQAIYDGSEPIPPGTPGAGQQCLPLPGEGLEMGGSAVPGAGEGLSVGGSAVRGAGQGLLVGGSAIATTGPVAGAGLDVGGSAVRGAGQGLLVGGSAIATTGPVAGAGLAVGGSALTSPTMGDGLDVGGSVIRTMAMGDGLLVGGSTWPGAGITAGDGLDVGGATWPGAGITAGDGLDVGGSALTSPTMGDGLDVGGATAVTTGPVIGNGLDVGGHSPQSRYSLLCDGTGDYVTVPAASSLEPTHYSLVAWVRTSTTAATFHRVIMYLFDAGSGATRQSYSLGITDSWYPDFRMQDSAGNTDHATGTAALNDGAWHYLTATTDGTTLKLYVDGVEVATAARTFTVPYYVGPVGLFIGSYYTSGAPLQGWDGELDQVAVLGLVLTAGDVAALAAGTLDPSGLSPLGLWRFDEGTGTAAGDGSGNGNTGTLIGGATWSPDVPPQLD